MNLNITYYNMTISNLADVFSYNLVVPYFYETFLVLIFAMMFLRSKNLNLSLIITSLISIVLNQMKWLDGSIVLMVLALTLGSFAFSIWAQRKEKKEIETYGLEKI
jgi:cellulose synthase/poly-beta-1,6-N-acetylglucosamine synthase-like glycosyltransferase